MISQQRRRLRYKSNPSNHRRQSGSYEHLEPRLCLSGIPFDSIPPTHVEGADVLAPPIIPLSGTDDLVPVANDGITLWYNQSSSYYYSGTHQRTYYAFTNAQSHVVVNYFDHATGHLSSEVLVDDLPLRSDDHLSPAIHVIESGPDAGKILLAYSHHSSDMFVLRSTSAEDLTAFEQVEILDGFFTYPAFVDNDGSISLFFRQGLPGAGAPKGMYNFIQSDDGGGSWSDVHLGAAFDNPWFVFGLPPVAQDGELFMAFYYYRTDQPNPQNSLAYTTSSDGGQTWESQSGPVDNLLPNNLLPISTDQNARFIDSAYYNGEWLVSVTLFSEEFNGLGVPAVGQIIRVSDGTVLYEKEVAVNYYADGLTFDSVDPRFLYHSSAQIAGSHQPGGSLIATLMDESFTSPIFEVPFLDSTDQYAIRPDGITKAQEIGQATWIDVDSYASYFDFETSLYSTPKGVGIDDFSIAQSEVGVDLANLSQANETASDVDLTGRRSIVGSRFHDAIFGDGQSNLFWGYDANDDLRGSGGDDYLDGGSGDDFLDGGPDNDVLRGGPGADSHVGGTGTDFADYRDARAKTIVDLARPEENTRNALGDSYEGIEGVIGSRHRDSLRGDNHDNLLFGGLGSDVILGRHGSDTINGGGDDDYLWGNEGSDTFVFEKHAGNDRVLDFECHADILQFNFPYDVNALTITENEAGTVIQHGANQIQLDNVYFSDDTAITEVGGGFLVEVTTPENCIRAAATSAIAKTSVGLFFANDLGVYRVDPDNGDLIQLDDPNIDGGFEATPREFTEIDGAIYFTDGAQIWRTQGVAGDIVPLAGASNGNSLGEIAELTALGSTLFFVATDSLSGAFEVWLTDGTPDSAQQVTDLNPPIGLPPTGLTESGGLLYFSAFSPGDDRSVLYKSDGTGNTSQVVDEFDEVSEFPANLTDLNGQLIFARKAGEAFTELVHVDTQSSQNELIVLRDFGTVSEFAQSGEMIYFVADGDEIWRTDGTPDGTVRLADLRINSESDVYPFPKELTNIGDTLFFTSFTPSGNIPGVDRELRVLDYTTGTVSLAKDIRAGDDSSNPNGLVDFNGQLVFAANDGVHGSELWSSDGTEAGTTLLADIFPGTDGSIGSSKSGVFESPPVVFDSQLFFAADDGVSGEELRRFTFPTIDVDSILLTVDEGSQVHNTGTYRFAESISTSVGSAQLLLEDPIPERIQGNGTTVRLEDVVTLPQTAIGEIHPRSNPRTRINFGYHSRDNSDRLFVNDIRGQLYAIDPANQSFTEYINISNFFPHWFDSLGFNSGFSTFAFHPEYASNGLLYTIHTETPNGAADYASSAQPQIPTHSVLVEWQTADPAAEIFIGTTHRELLRIEQPSVIHGMQSVQFNPLAAMEDPDYGMLYVTIGDGEATNLSDAPQNLQSLQGTIIRIDPAGNDSPNGNYGLPADNPIFSRDNSAPREIYAYGFRNPNRLAWDPVTQKMILAEIGQGNIEELNLIVPGANYGWNEREGTFVFDRSNPDTVLTLPPNDSDIGYTYPVAQYDHDEGFAIMGGFVYQGDLMPQMRGKYIFGDLVKGHLFYVNVDELNQGDLATIHRLILEDENGQAIEFKSLVDSTNQRADLRFGLDQHGEIYVMSKQDGVVRRLVGGNPESAAATTQTNLPTPVAKSGTWIWSHTFETPGLHVVTVEVTDQNGLAQHITFDVDVSDVPDDFGDAPDSYRTLVASDGARHANRGPFLGTLRDDELDGHPSANAEGDDRDGDDEDGVVFTRPLLAGSTASIEITASEASFLDAWIDFDGDGSWHHGEQVAASLPLTAGSNTLEFVVDSAAYTIGNSYARFRVSSTGGLAPHGPASDGEVEDYSVDFESQEALNLGSLGAGVAGLDNASGTGYLMYSRQRVHDRFSGVFGSNADHLITVQHRSGVWFYGGNGPWAPFDPEPTDQLLAKIDYDNDLVEKLQGYGGQIWGIDQGYDSGDFELLPNQFAGVPNPGEFQATGTVINIQETPSQWIQLGSLGLGIPGPDGSGRTGYILYSSEDLQTRYPAASILPSASRNLIIASYFNEKWHINDNSMWHELGEIREDDRLLARIDMGADTIVSLEGFRGEANGINQGYTFGDLTFAANQYNGQSNAGEFTVGGTSFEIAPIGIDRTELGNINLGIAAIDSAVGTAYIMHSQENLHGRFANEGILSYTSDHLVVVKHVDGQWYFDNNSTLVSFTPEPSDRLLAKLDLGADTITSLQGFGGQIRGINQGYTFGDLHFEANVFNGEANGGEFTVSGTSFEVTPSDDQWFELGDINLGVASFDGAVGSGYLMFSEQNLHTRFAGEGIVSSNSDHVIAVKLVEGQWLFDNNSTLIPFTPELSDRLLAKVDFASDAVTALAGVAATIDGINSGYTAGDLTFVSNQFAGVPNVGEFTVLGTSFGVTAGFSVLLPAAEASAEGLDVNDDGQVSLLDALRVINRLSAEHYGRAAEFESAQADTGSDLFFMAEDTNRDGKVTPLDGLLILNHLSQLEEEKDDSDAGFAIVLEDDLLSQDDDEDVTNEQTLGLLF